MYNPTKFKIADQSGAFSFMLKNPFATVISYQNDELITSHLPLTVINENEELFLMGHMAKANPHSSVIAKMKNKIIFHGAHTYITAAWYAQHDVPTWNYSVLHAQGSAKLIEDYGGIINCLKILTEHSEKIWPSGWKFFIPDDLPPVVLTKSIVGFKIKIESIDFKRKLSQNRSVEDQEGVMKGLATRLDEQSHLVLMDMKKK